MKFILAILALFAAVLSAQAQFIAGPTRVSAITNAGTWAIAPADGGGAATNVPTGQVHATGVTIGANGFGVTVKAYGTNAALTTNTWFVLEATSGTLTTASTLAPISNQTYTVVFLPVGVATNVYYTNFDSRSAALINLGNVAAVRIKNVMQTNGVIGGSLAGNLFVEKFEINAR
jgi:hypothetical protein